MILVTTPPQATFNVRMAEASTLLRRAIERGKLLRGNKKALATAKRNQRRWNKAAREEEIHSAAMRVIAKPVSKATTDSI